MGVAMQISSRKVAAVINVTPMIDILLVLLIAFMLLPDRSHGLPANVPEPAPESQPAIAHPLDSVLRIQKDHSIQIDSQPVLALELAARLKFLTATRPGGVLFVQAAPELDYADVATVIDIARGAGWNRVGLLTERSGP
jgi:biopolymer transport protein ExbD/biopolymer transport protein TolR